MSGANEASIVLGFPDYRQPARRLAAAVHQDYADIHVRSFPDGESLVRLPEELPQHVILCCNLADANRSLIEFELAAATALRLGAERLTLVAPYLCYMRQDIAFNPGEAISQEIIGGLLAGRVDTLITVDPHLHRTARLEDAVPVRHAVAVSAAPVMAGWLAGRASDPLIVGPDEESMQWVSRIAAPGGLDFCIARKQRFGDREVQIELPDRDFGGRDVVLVDDVASTGQTLAETARQLADRSARSISVLVSHALFVDDAVERLHAAGVGEICSTDSVPHSSNCLRLDGLLADALFEAQRRH